jgi:signal transduction histidine kinase
MTDNVLQFPNALAGGTVCTHNVAARATEWIRKWFRRSHREQLDWELKVCLEERGRERVRIARELHDTMFQGFIGASMQLHAAMEQMPPDSSNKVPLNRALLLMQRVLDEGRVVLEGLRSPGGKPKPLEEALSSLRDELAPIGTLFRVFVTGRSKALKPEIHQQLYLIGREALINALRHSKATNIEAEIEYLPRRLRMVVRDDGCGMDRQVIRHGRNAHWGLVGMRERAGSIGAKLRIRSRLGFGTEIELSVPGDIVEDCA